MNVIWPLLLVALLQQSFDGGTAAVEHLFGRGKTWPQFLCCAYSIAQPVNR